MNNREQIQAILKSKVGHLNQHLTLPLPNKKKVVKGRQDCKEVQWMHWQLKYWCYEQKIKFEKEYKFSKRKFRFDFALPDNKIGLEYDGLMSKKSGHTTLLGYTSDTEKLNLAAKEGWNVLRYTVLNYKNVLQDIQKIIK